MIDRLVGAARLLEELSQRETCQRKRSCLELLTEIARLAEPLRADR